MYLMLLGKFQHCRLYRTVPIGFSYGNFVRIFESHKTKILGQRNHLSARISGLANKARRNPKIFRQRGRRDHLNRSNSQRWRHIAQY